MKLLWLLCLLPLLAAGKKKTGVRELNDTNIDAALTASNDEAWLLLLYASWCGHCRHFKPEFQKLAAKLKDDPLADGQIVKLGQADIDLNPAITSRFLVSYLPALFYVKEKQAYLIDFQNSALKGYGTGRRDAETLYDLLQSKDVTQIFKPSSELFGPWSPLMLVFAWVSQNVYIAQKWAKVQVQPFYPDVTDQMVGFGLLGLLCFLITGTAFYFLSVARSEYKAPPAVTKQTPTRKPMSRSSSRSSLRGDSKKKGNKD